MAILLEVARILGGAECFEPDYTLFFVAIDNEEDGSFGSQEFLHKIIVPYYIKQGVGIQVNLMLMTIKKLKRRETRHRCRCCLDNNLKKFSAKVFHSCALLKLCSVRP